MSVASAECTETVISTERLTRSYGEGRGIFDIDLSVKRGQVFGMVGPNGAGKTTLLSVIAGTRQAESGLTASIDFSHGDVLALEPREEFADADLLTCFMMGHDFWPRERCLATLQHLRRVFPKARRFLLGDTARTTGVADGELPIFTLGFEVGHGLMGVGLPTLDEWEEVFAESDWNCVSRHTIDVPAASAIFELE